MFARALHTPPLAALAVLLIGTPAAQAAPAFGEETLSARLGGYISDFDTNVRLSGPRGGSNINLEDTLGLDSEEAVFRGDLTWRFADKHRLSLGYVDFQRQASNTAKRDFEVETDDGRLYAFKAGATVQTEFDWRLLPLTYSYSWYKTDHLEMAASAGIHWFTTKLGFAGNAIITGQDGSTSALAATSTSENASGPLPVFGLDIDYALTDAWVLGGQFGWFGLDYEGTSGELIDLRVNAEYWFNDYFGAGLGYSHYAIDIKHRDGDYTFGADYTYQGVDAYLSVRY